MDFKQQYFNAWRSVWEYHKKWSGNGGTDDEWQNIVDESADILKQYENTPEYNFVKDLLLAVISEIERVDKLKRKEQK